MLSQKQKKAIESLLDGCSKQEAAEWAGVTPVTISRWLQEETFRAELQQASNQAFQDAANRLSGAMDTAIETLINGAETGGKGASVKIRAAGMILSHAQRMKETADLSERIKVLEEQANNVKQP